MAFTIKNNEKIAVAREITQGVYVGPSQDSFVQPLSDGIELNPAKELLDRDILTPNIGQILPRTGIRSVSGSIGVEARAAVTEGAVPEQGLLTEAALGAVRQFAQIALPSQAFTDGQKTFTFTANDGFQKDDILVIKFPGAYHFSSIVSVSGTTATMLVGVEGAKTAAIYNVAARLNYIAANGGHPSFSVTKEVGFDLVEAGLGCRVSNFALENFTTGQLPTHTYGVDGLTYDWSVGGVDIEDSDTFNFILANAQDDDETVSVSVNGATATVFTFNATTPGANVFATTAELVALLNGVAGLTATTLDNIEVSLVSSLKENGSISIDLESSTGTNPFDKFNILLTAIPATSASLPPVILQACVYQNDARIIVNEVAFTVENSLGYITSTCDINGRISSRVTSRATTGTFNPYKTVSLDGDQTEADTLAQFNLFNNNTPYSLFLYAGNPTAVAGEFSEIVAYYMPSCLSTEIPEGDADDVLQYNISFTASSGPTGGDADIIVAYV